MSLSSVMGTSCSGEQRYNTGVGVTVGGTRVDAALGVGVGATEAFAVTSVGVWLVEGSEGVCWGTGIDSGSDPPQAANVIRIIIAKKKCLLFIVSSKPWS